MGEEGGGGRRCSGDGGPVPGVPGRGHLPGPSAGGGFPPNGCPMAGGGGLWAGGGLAGSRGFAPGRCGRWGVPWPGFAGRPGMAAVRGSRRGGRRPSRGGGGCPGTGRGAPGSPRRPAKRPCPWCGRWGISLGIRRGDSFPQPGCDFRRRRRGRPGADGDGDGLSACRRGGGRSERTVPDFPAGRQAVRRGIFPVLTLIFLRRRSGHAAHRNAV